jgi:DNA-binding transcriptional regulator YiaG
MERLAQALGVSVTTVYRWESGQVPIAPLLERALQSVEREREHERH